MSLLQPGADPKNIQPQVTVLDLGVPCRDIRIVHINGAAHLPEAERANRKRIRRAAASA